MLAVPVQAFLTRVFKQGSRCDPQSACAQQARALIKELTKHYFEPEPFLEVNLIIILRAFSAYIARFAL